MSVLAPSARPPSSIRVRKLTLIRAGVLQNVPNKCVPIDLMCAIKEAAE